MKNNALLVAGLIFVIVAIAHIVRFVYKTPVIIGPHAISMEVSLVGFVVAGLLAIWMFIARSSRN